MKPLLFWLLLPFFLLGCTATSNHQASLRVLSYNIKHGLGQDGMLDLERQARIIEQQRPNVVLLQEVDENCQRSDGVDQAHWFATRLGMEARFASFMDYDGGRYGLAILSRYPIVDSNVLDLPPGLHEPRSALVVTVAIGRRRLRIANAHLDWLSNDKERVAQAKQLRVALSEAWLQGSLGEVPAVLLGGDLNDSLQSDALSMLTEPLEASPGMWLPEFEWLGPSGPTFPSHAPDRTIDHFLICQSGEWVGYGVEVLDEPVASDHCPLVAHVGGRQN